MKYLGRRYLVEYKYKLDKNVHVDAYVLPAENSTIAIEKMKSYLFTPGSTFTDVEIRVVLVNLLVENEVMGWLSKVPNGDFETEDK